MDGQAMLQAALRNAFDEIRKRRPAVSLRQFAKDLKIAPSALSQILSGKRRVSSKLAERLLARLPNDQAHARRIVERIGADYARRRARPTGVRHIYSPIDDTKFQVVRDWHHFAILSLMETESYRSDPAWIAKRLGISVTAVQSSLAAMARIGLLRETPSGLLRPSAARFAAPDDVMSRALRRNHRQSLRLAAASLVHDSIDMRDFTSVTMAIDPERLVEVKELIRKFSDEASSVLEQGRRSEVYKLCVQLFPLSKDA